MTLQAWSRRAEISCDRAALLCCKDLDVAFRSMLKTALGLEQSPELNLDEYLKQLPGTRSGLGKYAELFRSHPYLPKRVQALKLFSESAFYLRYTGDADSEGKPAEQVDREVGQILSVFS
jgi:Zn-dependent protease with chaperone function